MQLLDSESATTMSNSKELSPFMSLPTEVREMIYRYLVIAKYVRKEHNMNTKEFDWNRTHLQTGPDHTYAFFPSIMGTNRKIREEAMDLCRRKNDFVCLTSRQPSHITEVLKDAGLGMIATGTEAHAFWNISMTLSVDPVNTDGWPFCRWRFCRTASDANTPECERPWRSVFCSDELPTFCRLLLTLSKFNTGLLQDIIFHVEINPAIWNGQATEIDSTPAGLSRMQKLLEPLRQLHSIGAAHVEGPLSSSYKASINASICGDCPTAFDIMQISMRDFNQGEKDLSEGQPLKANQMYKSALNHVSSCCWGYDEHDIITGSGPFPRLTFGIALSNLKVRLQARIASVYLEAGKMRMARIYTERAMDPRRPYDSRGNKEYTLKIDPWEHVVYAEVLHVAAQIRYLQGNMWEAMEHLSEAGSFVPLTEDQKAIYDAWQVRADLLNQRGKRKQQARDLLRKQHEKKKEEFFLVTCNWKKKGDRLLRRGKSHLAISQYLAALGRTKWLDDYNNRRFQTSWGSYTCYDPTDAVGALTFKLQASLAAAYLMSQRYDDVIPITEAALEISHEYRDITRYDRDRELKCKWREDQTADYQKVYQCRALAHKHMGDTVQAVDNMEQALSFDLGDSGVIALLAQLKEQLEEEVARHGFHAVLTPPDEDESSDSLVDGYHYWSNQDRVDRR